ncbi:hypothetical protein BLNAU_2162 [Blattamonas nauphoetae]|uniref:Uncharacterized protein n=1 Tax=Blattamonas nauphoetae TaxID=2049346 RepID=A0ABQ9YG27_9EUKA|nr:hypothetical protein BLNAU_2162 [Blattamonas nauphoetae]
MSQNRHPSQQHSLFRPQSPTKVKVHLSGANQSQDSKAEAHQSSAFEWSGFGAEEQKEGTDFGWSGFDDQPGSAFDESDKTGVATEEKNVDFEWNGFGENDNTKTDPNEARKEERGEQTLSGIEWGGFESGSGGASSTQQAHEAKEEGHVQEDKETTIEWAGFDAPTIEPHSEEKKGGDGTKEIEAIALDWEGFGDSKAAHTAQLDPSRPETDTQSEQKDGLVQGRVEGSLIQDKDEGAKQDMFGWAGFDESAHTQKKPEAPTDAKSDNPISWDLFGLSGGESISTTTQLETKEDAQNETEKVKSDALLEPENDVLASLRALSASPSQSPTQQSMTEPSQIVIAWSGTSEAQKSDGKEDTNTLVEWGGFEPASSSSQTKNPTTADILSQTSEDQKPPNQQQQDIHLQSPSSTKDTPEEPESNPILDALRALTGSPPMSSPANSPPTSTPFEWDSFGLPSQPSVSPTIPPQPQHFDQPLVEKEPAQPQQTPIEWSGFDDDTPSWVPTEDLTKTTQSVSTDFGWSSTGNVETPNFVFGDAETDKSKGKMSEEQKEPAANEILDFLMQSMKKEDTPSQLAPPPATHNPLDLFGLGSAPTPPHESPLTVTSSPELLFGIVPDSVAKESEQRDDKRGEVKKEVDTNEWTSFEQSLTNFEVGEDDQGKKEEEKKEDKRKEEERKREEERLERERAQKTQKLELDFGIDIIQMLKDKEREEKEQKRQKEEEEKRKQQETEERLRQENEQKQKQAELDRQKQLEEEERQKQEQARQKQEAERIRLEAEATKKKGAQISVSTASTIPPPAFPAVVPPFSYQNAYSYPQQPQHALPQQGLWGQMPAPVWGGQQTGQMYQPNTQLQNQFGHQQAQAGQGFPPPVGVPYQIQGQQTSAQQGQGGSNSTLSLGTLTFEEGKHGLCEGSADSYCSLTKCIVAFNGRTSLFESDGIVSVMWSQIEPSFDVSTSTLASSGPGKMALLLIGNSFTNWRSHETSLSGTDFARLDLSLCHFVNVSHMSSPRHQPLHQALQKTLISGNTLSQVENDLYGALFRDMNNMNEIHAINTTFTASYHSELTSYATQYPSTVDTSTAGNSFQNCLFKGCRTGASGGGLFHNSAAPLSVTSCGFESCRSEATETVTGTHGGGMCVLSTATAAVTVDIKKSTFKSCFASHRGAGFDLRSGNAVRVLKITLEDLALESNSGGNCVCFAAVHLTDPTLSNITCQDSNATNLEAGGRLEHVNGETKMTNILFLNLIAYGNSALAMDQLSGTVRFEHLKIANCRTDVNAPFGIGANLVNMPQGSITFTDCFFEHNVETTGQITGASDITLHGGSVTTASGQPSLSVKNVQNSEWIVTNNVIDVNNQTGQDALFCWIPGSQCRTMTDVIGNRLGPWYVGKIAIAEGEYHETKLMMKNQSLVVEGRGSAQTTMLDAGSDTTLFTITTGKLSASSLRFVPFASSHLITLSDEGTVSVSDSSVQTVEPSVKLSKAVFSVAAGTLLLTRVECSSLSFTDTAVLILFSSLARSLTLKNSSFESISSSGGGSCISTTISEGQSVQIGEQGGSDSFSSCSSDGDGGALNAKLSLSGSLTIVSTHFSDCSSSGRGGALFVELDRTNSETEWSFDLSGTSFGSDSEKNTATKGQNIFILGAFFETTVDPSVLPAVTAATDEAEMWGEDGNSTVDSTLLVYLVPFENKAVVGGTNAFDIPHCGHFGVGCVSIQKAFNQVKTSASPSLTLSFESEASLSESFSFETTQTVTFESATQSKPTIEVKASGRLSVSSGTLVLSTLSFTSSVSPFTSSFITLSGGSLSVSGCSFTGISSSESGGVVKGTVSRSSSLIVTGSDFTSCNSSLNGGAISVTCAPNTPFSCLVLKATFDSCWCGSESKGDWVFVSGSGLPSLVDPPNWETTTTGLTQPTDSSKLWGSDSSPWGSSLSSSTLLVYLLPHSAGSIFTSSSSGSEEIGCGEPSTPCKKLSTSLSRISSSPNSLSIQDSATLDFTLTSSLADLTVTGLTTPQKTLSIASNGGITSTSNKLSFVFLAFSTTTELFSHTLISIQQTGSVSVTSCSFSSFSLSDSPLFDHQNGELNLKSCSFSNIHRSEGNGSCVHSALSGNMLLKVDDVWMTDVDVSEGSGDGIFVSFPSSLSFNVASFSLTNLHFASSPSKNADSSKSRFLFLTGFNFSSWIEVGDARFTGSFEGSDVKADWLWTEDQHADIKLPASLLFYLTAHVGAVGVDESGFNTANCGFQTVWCPTLLMALDRLSAAQSSSVVVQVRVEINTTIAFTSSTVLTGLTKSSQLEIGEDTLFEVHTANVDLEITSLVFRLPPTLSSPSLFAVTEGSLTLSAVSFVSSDPDNLFSSQLINTAAPLSLTSVNVSSASLSSVALIESWSDVLVAGCRFSSISRSTGLGSVIEANISLSTSLKIVHTTFENCESGSTTNWILLKGLNSLASQMSSWEGTISRSSVRSGVMIVDSDESNAYFLIDILFPPTISSVVFVGSGGIDDRAKCGDESAPCRTISFGFEVGLTRNDSSEAVAVSLVGQTGFGACVWIRKESLSIEAAVKQTRLLVEDDLENDSDGDGVVNVEGGNVALSDLTVLLPTSVSSKTPARPISLVFGSGTVVISNVHISQSTAQNVNMGLCWIVGGSLSLEYVHVSHIDMSEAVCLIFTESVTEPILCSIQHSEITRTTSNTSPLFSFSASSQLSQCRVTGCTFSHSAHTHRETQSESAASVLAITTKQTELSVEDTTFEDCSMIPSSSTASILHVTVVAHPSQSVSTIRVLRCKFLSLSSASRPPSFLHVCLHSSHACVLFEDSLFSESAQTNKKGGVLVEYSTGLPIVVRRRTVFKHCTVILSEIIPQSSIHQNSQHDEL